MPAYLVVDIDIQNADEYEKYKALQSPLPKVSAASTGFTAATWISFKPIVGVDTHGHPGYKASKVVAGP